MACGAQRLSAGCAVGRAGQTCPGAHAWAGSTGRGEAPKRNTGLCSRRMYLILQKLETNLLQWRRVKRDVFTPRALTQQSHVLPQAAPSMNPTKLDKRIQTETEHTLHGSI